MNYIIIIIFFLVLLIFSTYIYKKVNNLLLELFPKRRLKLFSFLIASIPIIMSFTRNFSSFLVFLLYIVLLSIPIDILNIYFKKFNNNIWKKLHNLLIIPIILSTILTFYGYYNAHNIQKISYDVISHKEIKQDYKVALISDLHFGTNFDLKSLKKQVDIISNENPDIVVLAGDIIDEQTPVDSYADIFNILSNIKSQYGIYYVLGNHDENRYIEPKDNRNIELNNSILKSNIKILKDSSHIINDDFIISGRIDYSYRQLGQRSSASEIIKNLDRNKFLMILDHQPSQYKENKNVGYDLQLSGHTHAGQIWPFGLITRTIGFDYGLLNEDKFNLIVSSGMGVWGPPVRTEEKSEYVIINIKKEI
ncbi:MULTISPECIES: metallophosphoesterase [unclassified Gemella]|uniref:metallophosphoesterase n=1 Tax=unclassified Gemella TaxID=2624949 RepID=UPI001074290E|nr:MULTISPECIES: metallophosphoesterase [unclassified Gemella]MBF0710144.1 metallophosphoesterase [Gemella sp. GL1.1]MBF0746223.1 metallophosphoesterase [Gemella sp. 19428wG2_WT2a]NYS27488.1 metallophosphoesterase [Gemella sp. GL1]TFU60506.1 metallophosphoesterase [Gemella sp. WT2a]